MSAIAHPRWVRCSVYATAIALGAATGAAVVLAAYTRDIWDRLTTGRS